MVSNFRFIFWIAWPAPPLIKLSIAERIIFKKSKVKISEKFILDRITDREQAKKNGNYKLADQIRNKLNKEGIDIKDEKGKTTWSYKWARKRYIYSIQH